MTYTVNIFNDAHPNNDLCSLLGILDIQTQLTTLRTKIAFNDLKIQIASNGYKDTT